MSSRLSRTIGLSTRHPEPTASPIEWALMLKAFLTAVMGLLSLLVCGLGFLREDVLWSWIGFLCVLVSGFFLQMSIERKKKDAGAALKK
jgi:hypothetical protein